MIDLDTGGGERFFWEPRPVGPGRKWWQPKNIPPNFRLATERLAPLGVQVVDVRLTDDDPMPFAAGEFDLVLNRHAGFNPSEVAGFRPGRHIS